MAYTIETTRSKTLVRVERGTAVPATITLNGAERAVNPLPCSSQDAATWHALVPVSDARRLQRIGHEADARAEERDRER